VNSNSVLVALIDSHYIEQGELVEKALLLQSLEDAVGRGQSSPRGTRPPSGTYVDPEFRAFILEPRIPATSHFECTQSFHLDIN
jgi:hypothetical protein